MPVFEGPVAYVVKRYPRLSETFILGEILAHEQAGLPLHIFSLGPPQDGPFQDRVGEVRAPVRYLTATGLKPSAYWQAIEAALDRPWFRPEALREARGEDPRRIYQALRLAVAARDLGVRHFHAHFATSATDVARLASQWTGIPYSFTAHAKDVFHRDVAHDALRRKLFGAAAVVTVSDFNVEFLRRSYGEAANRVVRIYNGLDLERLAFDDSPREPRVVGVGRLVAKKGFAHLIEAVAKLRARGVTLGCDLI
ncbi:MAG: glycosyltransferase [Deltaproteobacteria bacterium]|nr:glycosyltransferase [Deltaproteobacteria bacterium]